MRPNPGADSFTGKAPICATGRARGAGMRFFLRKAASFANRAFSASNSRCAAERSSRMNALRRRCRVCQDTGRRWGRSGKNMPTDALAMVAVATVLTRVLCSVLCALCSVLCALCFVLCVLCVVGCPHRVVGGHGRVCVYACYGKFNIVCYNGRYLCVHTC